MVHSEQVLALSFLVARQDHLSQDGSQTLVKADLVLILRDVASRLVPDGLVGLNCESLEEIFKFDEDGVIVQTWV